MIKTNKYLNINMLNAAKFWLEYTPDWWQLNKIMKKEASELTEDELNILMQVKVDKRMLDNVNHFLELALLGDSHADLSSDEALAYESIEEYLATNQGFSKISLEEIEYVSMLYSDYDFNTRDLLEKALENINSPYLKTYAVAKKPYLHRNTSGEARAKKPHSVFPRVPNKIK